MEGRLEGLENQLNLILQQQNEMSRSSVMEAFKQQFEELKRELRDEGERLEDMNGEEDGSTSLHSRGDAMTNGGDSSDISVPTTIEGQFEAIVVCFFLGIGALVAWNSVLTISDFYSQLAPQYPSSVLTVVYQSFTFGTMIILAFYEAKTNARHHRILVGYSISSMSLDVFAVATLLTAGENRNYIGVCAVGIFGVADALVLGGIVGDLSSMDPTFVQSFFVGLAASGALASGLRLVAKAAFDKIDGGPLGSVFIILCISMMLLFISFNLYFDVFEQIPIVEHFRKKAAALEGSKTVTADLENISDAKHDQLSKKTLIHENLDLCFDLWLIYAVTSSVFPGFLFSGPHQLGSWYGVVLMALYNLFDLIGRCIPLADCIRLESRKGLVIACASCLLLVPCFHFAAKYGDQGWMILLVPFLGLTCGYLTVCAFTIAPRGYRAAEQNALGNLLELFLIGGMFSGVVLDCLRLIRNGPLWEATSFLDGIKMIARLWLF